MRVPKKIPHGALLVDGFNDCITGYRDGCVIYSYEACIDALIAQDFEYDEAVEYMDFNVVGACVGARTPIFERGHAL